MTRDWDNPRPDLIAKINKSADAAIARAEKVRRKASIMEACDLVHHGKTEALFWAGSQLGLMVLANWHFAFALIFGLVTLVQISDVRRLLRIQDQIAYCRREWGL